MTLVYLDLLPTYCGGINIASEPAYRFWRGKAVNELPRGAGFVLGNVLEM